MTVLGDGSMAIDVPVDVFLLGFPSELGSALQDRLTPFQVAAHYRENIFLPMVPTAIYRVHALPESAGQEFRDALQPAPERPDQLDGNLAEASLESIITGLGYKLSRALPALVFVHLGDDRVGDHSYLYRAENDWAPGAVGGFVQGARVFGGNAPFLVFDVSASEDLDPTYPSAGRDYEKPLSRTAAHLAEALQHAVRNTTLLRLFPDMGWEPSTAPCNAFTILFGIRAAALGGQAPATFDPRIHADRLTASFTKVAGKPAFVDVKTLLLPVDDPELDALTRAESAESTVLFPTNFSPVPLETWQLSNAVHSALNNWVDLNWDRSWVEHAGCEGYLGIFIWGDAADYPLNRGFAMHPSLTSHRWMMASLGVLMQADLAPTYVPFTGRGSDTGTDQFADGVVAHEFGHTLGLHHPSRVATTAAGAAPGDDWTFNKAINILSSSWMGKTAAFSVFDEATMARNEAGFAVKAAHEQGVLETASGVAAMEALAKWDWHSANELLRSGSV